MTKPNRKVYIWNGKRILRRDYLVLRRRQMICFDCTAKPKYALPVKGKEVISVCVNHDRDYAPNKKGIYAKRLSKTTSGA